MLRVAAAIAIATAACSDDAAPVIEEPLEFLDQVRAAECDTMVRCRIFGSAGQCDVYREQRLAFEWGVTLVPDVDWIAALADGAAVYSPEDAAACLAAWRAGTCRRSAGLDRCATVFRGVAIAGTTTRAPEVCNAGRWEASSCSNACCVGSCGRLLPTLPHPEGTECAFAGTGGQPCDPHLTCVRGRCARLAIGDVCSQDLDCPAGLTCDGRCRHRGAIGDRCEESAGCADLGSYCDAEQRCRRVPLAGEPCNDGVCGPGLGCDPSGRCAGFGAEGEPCPDFGPALCGPGLYCDFFTLACAPRLPDGASCTGREQCASRVCGDGSRCGVPCP